MIDIFSICELCETGIPCWHVSPVYPGIQSHAPVSASQSAPFSQSHLSEQYCPCVPLGHAENEEIWIVWTLRDKRMA
jgi:hypothetical protein